MRTRWFWKVSLLAAVVLGLVAWQRHTLQTRADDATPPPPTAQTFVSPLPTPPAVPTPVPTPSPRAAAALRFVAQRYGIPEARLEIADVYRRDYALLDRHFEAYTLVEHDTSNAFRLLVDLADGSVTDDIATLERAEAEARQKQYGKLDPMLYERLQKADDQELLPIAVWVGGPRGRSEEELNQVLADRHPEVKAALARHESPFDVPDAALARSIQQEYDQLRREDIAARIGPLVAHLQSQSLPVQSYSLLPSVAVTLTRPAILALAQRDDVETLYLIEGMMQPALDTAIPTDRVAPLWSALGISGAEPFIPQTIAIVEHGNVAYSNTFLHQAGIRLLADNGELRHTTMVASIAASFHTTYRGMAPGATILSAGENGQPDSTLAALNWAFDQSARIANFSECAYNNTPNLEWLDRAFDYTARTRHATITAAAGNHRQEYVCSPAKGWNVITVGGINDHGTTDWSDDTMADFSSYLDPTNRQKPEVSAPAQDITALELNNNPYTDSGTSFAAPQVAGLAALMMQRNAQLTTWPTAVKAILMASAVHNIEGSNRLSDQDGAGAIDAALAGITAQTRAADGATCFGPCWWGIATTSNYPSVGGSLNEYFQASRGERVRVAIAWWSQADPPPAYPNMANDALNTDFDLYIWRPSGSGAASSVSTYNNYEIVDFVAPETGTYRIQVLKYVRSTESNNELGIAWVKDATYLPIVANEETTYQPFASEIYLRNDSPLNRAVTINYAYSNGSPTPRSSDVCALAPNQWCWIPVDWPVNGLYRVAPGTRASATVAGGEEVSVVVLNAHAGTSFSADSYSGLSQAAATLYAPLVQANNNGWYSNFTILNTTGQDTQVTVQLA